MPDYSDSTNVVVQNSFAHAEIDKISFSHQFNSDEIQTKTWSDLHLKPGEVTPSFHVEYNAGGNNYWNVRVEIKINESTIAEFKNTTKRLSAPLLSNDAKAETDDDKLVFEVSESQFKVIKPSGDVEDTMSISVNANPSRPEPISYTNMGYVTIRNNFPISANVTISHQYYRNTLIKAEYKSLAPQGTTNPWPVFYNTGALSPGQDYWNVEVTFSDLSDAHPAAVWKNTTDFKATLHTADQGKIVPCTISGSEGFTMQFAKQKCVDRWYTPAGQTYTTFMTIKNRFKVPIRKVNLSYTYGKDIIANIVRYNIATDSNSSPFAVEFDTGSFSPYHHWNISVELEDGSCYENVEKDQRMYFNLDDDKSINAFEVSDSTFFVHLDAKTSFDVAMIYKGTFPAHQGRNLDRAYDKNAFLVAHNAFANGSNGFKLNQMCQNFDVHSQLAHGATALMFNIKDSIKEGIVVYKKDDKATDPKSLAEELRYVKDFMSSNPDEVVTIFLNDEVENQREKIQKAFESTGLWNEVFFCNQDTAGWSVEKNGWPTLRWMIEKKKRLVIFSTPINDPFPHQLTYMSESVFGKDSLDPTKWTDSRLESSDLNTKSLMLVNHYPATGCSSSSKKNNESAHIQLHVNMVQRHWKQLPNFLSLDFFECPEVGSNIAIAALNKKFDRQS